MAPMTRSRAIGNIPNDLMGMQQRKVLKQDLTVLNSTQPMAISLNSLSHRSVIYVQTVMEEASKTGADLCLKSHLQLHRLSEKKKQECDSDKTNLCQQILILPHSIHREQKDILIILYML